MSDPISTAERHAYNYINNATPDGLINIAVKAAYQQVLIAQKFTDIDTTTISTNLQELIKESFREGAIHHACTEAENTPAFEPYLDISKIGLEAFEAAQANLHDIEDDVVGVLAMVGSEPEENIIDTIKTSLRTFFVLGAQYQARQNMAILEGIEHSNDSNSPST